MTTRRDERPHLVIALRDCGARAIGGNTIRRAHSLSTRFRVSIVSDRFPTPRPALDSVALIEIRTADWTALRRFAHVPSEWSFANAVRRTTERLHRADPVAFFLCHGYSVARFAGLPLRRRLGIEFGMFMHGHIFERPTGTYDRRLTYFYRAIAPTCYREASLLFALSPDQAALAVRAGGRDERTLVAPNGIDPKDVGLPAPGEPEIERPRRADDGGLNLLYVGRFGPEKGVPTLLEACAQLDETATPFQLTLVGGGPEESRLRELAGRLGIAERCIFAGAVPRTELGRFYRAADVLCVPSLSEPQGNVVLEGMSAGCLVVASRTGGIPSMIEDGVSGRLVPPGDATALAATLAKVAVDWPRDVPLATCGRRVALERFGWDSIGARIATAVERLLSGDPRPAAERVEASAPGPNDSIPSVSVAIPTFGRDAVLLETVRQLLDQEPAPAEILLLDQNTELEPVARAALEEWQRRGAIRWLRLPRPSIPAAMNVALREARESVVLFIDDDVRLEPGMVGAHAAAFRDDAVSAVVGRILQPGESPRVASGYRPAAGLRRDLDFPFSGTERAMLANCMAGNLSVRRKTALGVGGFDENFVRTAYRFESEFARRLVTAGGTIRFEPGATLHHLRAPRGGTRGYGDHLTAAGPDHSVGDYYFALRCGRGADRLGYIAERFFRSVRTRFHLTHPWWIPVKLLGELRGLAWALRLHRRGPRLVSPLAEES